MRPFWAIPILALWKGRPEMSKQSSVEWLIEQIEAGKIEIVYSDKIHSIRCIRSIVEQAKAMHKAETCQFAGDWFQNCPIGGDVNSIEDATEYYKDTFA